MSFTYIKIGWMKLSKFAEISGVGIDAVKHRLTSTKFPEWRIGNGMVKLLPDGYHIHYEVYQEWVNNKPDNYKVA